MSKRKNNKKGNTTEQIFAKLLKLRQFCCHPKLLDSKSNWISYEDFRKHY